MSKTKKQPYQAPKLTTYGDFAKITRGAKGTMTKDSASAPLRTRAIGGPNP
jgi:hypothetical protein